eukprot:5799804-Amphidinium_carterae.1
MQGKEARKEAEPPPVGHDFNINTGVRRCGKRKALLKICYQKQLFPIQLLTAFAPDAWQDECAQSPDCEFINPWSTLETQLGHVRASLAHHAHHGLKPSEGAANSARALASAMQAVEAAVQPKTRDELPPGA